MAKKKATTPNQRLLEMIRRPGGKTAASAPPERKSVRGPRRFPFGKAVSVGVDIAPTRLTCIKVRGHDAGFEVLGAVVVPVPAGVAPGKAGFAELLRRALTELCGPGPLPRVWAGDQSSRANIQFVTIPKVSSGQVDNAVFWTAKKEMAFDEAAVIFDFERRGETTEKGMARLGALAYTAQREAAEALRSDFVKAGFPLAGLTLESFAHQNFFRRRVLSGAEGATANLHIGQNWSRLEIFNNGNLMFVRVIKTSMSGMEQAVQEALEANLSATPPPVSEQGMALAPGAAEETLLDLDDGGSAGQGLVLELEPEPENASGGRTADEADRPRVTKKQARELFWSIVYGCEDLDACHPGMGLNPEDVMGMLEPVASRLVRQVEMTLKHYRESLGYDAVTQLTVSGLLGGSKAFVRYIGEQTGLRCSPLDLLGARVPRVPLVNDWMLPATAWTQALGLAFADVDVTPSVFFTYKEKASARISHQLEQWTLIILAVVLAAMAFFSFDAASTRRALTRERDGLRAELASLGGEVDVVSLSRMADDLRVKREKLHAFAARNRAVGLWERALALAPDGVGVGTLTTELGAPRESGKKNGKRAKGAAAAATGRLVIDGMITGDARLFDSMLASYVVALEGEPLFENVTVKKSEVEPLADGASGLRYVIGIELPGD
ncbi:conserved hypothetical protein [Solidesulfovibrio fructosivorans JJ]]|uniref:Fimbrial assembly family protein n=1 Tax=Solidesulfovibrio fructosivorans JJ] TaxID=596151 RepID=E1K0G6_SOLFR|nr:hypothetical protein [Solidesulfovibrio fructosivorans]EFL49909.1 conserved hypothetical protein [Solidesulfovibrio fructosivorans JJ]]